MNNRIHDPECTCNECLIKEDQVIVDLKNSINITSVYALNERITQSCQKVFKDKDDKRFKTGTCRERAVRLFEQKYRFNEYIDLYESLI